MNKEPRDSKDKDKLAKKPRESSRRLSAIQSSTVTRRESLGERPSSREGDSTITRTTRRQSALAKTVTDATSPPPVFSAAAKAALSASPPPAAVSRRASLRPRNPATGSALPKYRPKSVIVESTKKVSTPPKLGMRRRLSSSDDEREPVKDPKKSPPVRNTSPSGRAARPISPLPRRAAEPSSNVTIHISPSTPVSKMRHPTRRTPSPTRQSPSVHPAKVSKTAKIASPSASAIPRPPSSSSSSSSLRTPRTPQTPTQARDIKGRMTASPGNHGTPLRQAARKQPDSPLAKHSKQGAVLRSPRKDRPLQSPAGSVFNEESSIDSVDDVEFLLGSAIAHGAPTPAVPRKRETMHRRELSVVPETPSRNALPTRANLSYLSPMPPTSDRPTARGGNDRGSLLSWDQLISVGEMTLGEGEIDKMIADIPAPFSGTASPAPSHMELDIPDSPSLSAMPSPIGYGSISQILLPDVTPSPAKFAHLTPERGTPVDSSLVMMLRLQLASMENIAKERLGQIQALEHQLTTAKEARLREADELARQVTTLEEQMRVALDTRETAMGEQAAVIAHLEEQMRGADALRERAVQQAARTAADGAMQIKVSAVQIEGRKWEAACVARGVATQWGTVRSVAEAELDLLRSNRETLSVLLAGLEQTQHHLCSVVAV
ncbi:hypothetical protein FA95DRAFT_1482958 [Auriscalpium vulgare]|uniref:Uncharacterized protein n=1 Tax=Auriscalpium vulgare TaxID=40419 RepID=A0ACB8SAR8_9AGAM|nr:hypothetical protein FA95DRAFT_1482958 [Auriscalpium vulgare]